MPMASIAIGLSGPERSASVTCFFTSRLSDQVSPSRRRYTTGLSRRMLSTDKPLVSSSNTL